MTVRYEVRIDGMEVATLDDAESARSWFTELRTKGEWGYAIELVKISETIMLRREKKGYE